MSDDFSGKVVVVTGGSRGIGRAIATAFAKAGAETVLAAASAANLARTATEIAAAGAPSPAVVAGDLRTIEGCEAVFRAVAERHGRCDILVNSAGATRAGSFLDLPDAVWQDGFALKFFACVRLSRLFWPMLTSSKGHVVNIIGGAARTPGADFLIGGSVNAAMANFSKGLSVLGKSAGVNVNAIHPGRTATDRTADLFRQRADGARRHSRRDRGGGSRQGRSPADRPARGYRRAGPLSLLGGGPPHPGHRPSPSTAARRRALLAAGHWPQALQAPSVAIVFPDVQIRSDGFMTGPAQRAHIPGDEPPSPRPGGIAARAVAARPAGYLDRLNPEQRLAVETTEGPVLVLAGAGTGKTRVLTTRIAHLLATNRARPWEILAVTFTNKAAREMKVRIGDLIGGVIEGMQWLGTFHSIGVKIIRRHAELVGLKSDFTILDTDDQVRLMKQIIQAEGIDEKRWPARQLAGLIDHWKNRGLAPKDVPEADGLAFADGRGKKLYAAYQERLKILNAADFGDLLLESLRIFRENPDVLADYHQRFRYMLVDEYQDTNVAQYLWLRLLAQARRNICCVGDDDQSIYGWRGAEVDNILRFEKDFPGATVIRLERNYRSTSHILGAASHLIAHNEGRLGKTLFTEAVEADAPKVSVASSWDSEEEARAVGEEIEQLQRDKHRLNEIAILVRASFQMRAFEDRFVTLGLPYRVIGGPRFYERQEIRDALAYFRAMAQPADDLAFERIINTPRRGIGDTTVKLLHDRARARRVPLMEASAELVADRRASRPHPHGAPRSPRRLRPLARPARFAAAHGARRDHPGGVGLHRNVAGRPLGRCPRAAREPQGAGALHGGVRNHGRVPRAHLAGDGYRPRGRRRCGQHHDAPLRQGT